MSQQPGILVQTVASALEDGVLAVLDNPAPRAVGQPPYSPEDTSSLAAIAAKRIDEKDRQLRELFAISVQCPWGQASSPRARGKAQRRLDPRPGEMRLEPRVRETRRGRRERRRRTRACPALSPPPARREGSACFARFVERTHSTDRSCRTGILQPSVPDRRTVAETIRAIVT